jgi:endonuclease/exonuclease/phosphatase family metal-dependent hydrolase
MQVLSWNLFHGRARTGRTGSGELLGEFAAALAGWDWDVALLQEVPPWWPRPLAERTRASMRMKLTSRNELLALRAALARRWPDVMKSGGGGCNAILVRGQAIAEHRATRLCWWPERRWTHAVRLADGTWAANLHASKQEPRARTERDVRRAGAALDAWVQGTAARRTARDAAPRVRGPSGRVVLSGDFNLDAPETLLPALQRIAGGGVDFILARGFERVAARALDAGPLSDHRPILAELRRV